MKTIPYGKHQLDQADIAAVVKTLKGDWLTQGPAVQKFEQALCKYTGAKYCVAVANGTVALHLSMLGLKVGKGDETISSPMTFAASANCALYVGATPRFVDMDAQTYHLDIEKLREFLESPSRRKKIKAVVLVHFMGTVAGVAEINRICGRYGIAVVEDAAHALGAKYREGNRWHSVGCSAHSKATILSFHPIKHITTGEGGAILSNDQKLYERFLRLRHHGIVRNYSSPGSLLAQYSKEAWFYDIPEIGFNGRITDFQCALGAQQLKKLDAFVKRRRELVERYNRAFADLKQIQLPPERKESKGSYHLYPIRVPADQRGALYNFLKERKILAQVNYVPVHLLTAYQKAFGYHWGDFPAAEQYFTECLSLPMHAALKDQEHRYVVRAVRDFFSRA